MGFSSSLINSENNTGKGQVEMGKIGKMQKSVWLSKPYCSSDSLY